MSAMNVVVTQTLLQSSYRFTPIGAAWANVLAVGLSALPAFVILRRWVWDRSGECSVTREIIPFWTYTFLGLIVSIAAVAAIDARRQSANAVSVANIACFGALWVTKFLFLDQWLFDNQRGAARRTAPASRTRSGTTATTSKRESVESHSAPR